MFGFVLTFVLLAFGVKSVESGASVFYYCNCSDADC